MHKVELNNIIKVNNIELNADEDTLDNLGNTLTMKVMKRICMCLNVAVSLVHADFYVQQSLQKEIILGIDWFQKHNIKTDFGDRTLSIDQKRSIISS